jgi:signal transduction histidine kinase
MVLVLCLCVGAMHQVGLGLVVAALVAVSLAAVRELNFAPSWVPWLLPLSYLGLAVLLGDFTLLVPLAVYDLARQEPPWFAAAGVFPLLIWAHGIGRGLTGALVAIGAVAVVLARRTGRTMTMLRVYRDRSDALADASRSLEARNRDLRERGELEVRLATLGERARIAREIHDNVGHLLTRSGLQGEALQVVHAGQAAREDELAQVSRTLHTAFDTVRASVHGLHDEALDLRAGLEDLAGTSATLAVTVVFEAGDLPPAVTAAFMAIVREALANAERHSDATTVRVRGIEFPGLYQLTVVDNGTKPPRRRAAEPPGPPGGVGGIGLANMEERVRALGGVFRAGYDHGFRIIASVPVAASGASAAAGRPADPPQEPQ